jgi:hypothetical protein
MGKRKKKNRNKFEFGTDFQELILQYTVTDPKGFKALELYDDTYFVLIPHSIIALALKRYYKKHKNIPEESYLREFLRILYKTDKVIRDTLPADRDIISNILSKIYASKVKDPDVVLEKCVSFARYVQFKETMEEVDMENFDSWNHSIDKLKKASSIGNELVESYGTFVVSGMPDRAHKRDTLSQVTPTPFWQLNNLLNSGGTEKGNIMVLLGKEKDFKTGGLLNIARGYLKMRKKVFFADLENGEIAITVRAEQSISNKEQEFIRSGDHDDHLLKLFRKYKRIGSELLVKRFPALKTTTDDLQHWLDMVKRDLGITFDVGIVDYGMLLGATSGKTDDYARISDAFLDLKNFADHNKFEAIWTGAHVTREGSKVRRKGVYQSTDIAKCIDIPRHVDALFGLQQNEEEEENKVLRMEVVEQRNGMKNGKMLFWIDIPKQRIKEFNKAEVKEYWRQLGDRKDDDEDDKPRKRGQKKTDL